jgi:hypothetical protein
MRTEKKILGKRILKWHGWRSTQMMTECRPQSEFWKPTGRRHSTVHTHVSIELELPYTVERNVSLVVEYYL